MEKISTILLPTRPQPDTIVAIFFLNVFGREQFAGVEDARVEVRSSLAPEETFDNLLTQGIIALDLGGGPFDHHHKPECTSELVARYLGVEKDPSIGQLLHYAKRDEREGKGTISRDAIDRAFGLSGLIAALNKANPKDPQKVVAAALPLLEAHWRSAKEHHVELPREVAEKQARDEYREYSVTQGGKTFKLVTVISDKPSMPTYLRSERGGKADIVLQKAETSNHYCVLTNQKRGVDLSKVAGLIRLREAEIANVLMPDEEGYLTQIGRVEEVPQWYFDPATNSLLNGGPHNSTVSPSEIEFEELRKIVIAGIEVGSPQSQNASSYYLSVHIKEEAARAILSKLEVPAGVKAHDPKNVHVTLQYFGAKSPAEVERMVSALQTTLLNQKQFALKVEDTQLASGSPEGYGNTHAWYLTVDPTSVSILSDIRNEALSAIGLPNQKKMFHITLAVNRDRAKKEAAGVVSLKEPFAFEIPVTELVLMENAQAGMKRTYRAHTVFPLS